MSFDVDAVIAAADLAGRAGGSDFQVGYLNDEDDPAYAVVGPQWYAYVQYRGARLTSEGHPGPAEAADGLARKMLTGARCRCGSLVALSDFGAEFVAGTMVDGSTWTPEEAAKAGQCRWTRMGERWEPGCDAPPIKMNRRL